MKSANLVVLVTGANGQVGSELCRLNLPEDVNVVGYSSAELDITNESEIDRRFVEANPSVVINCAAYTAVDLAEADVERAYLVNETGALHLATSCCRARIPLIHLSTDYVFDGMKRCAYRESDEPGPLGVYGASKLAGEEKIRQVLESHLILRASWIFGCIGRGFVDTVLRLAEDRDELSIVDDQIGAPCYSVSLAEALISVAKKLVQENGNWGTYHFTSEPATSWFDFARGIVKEAVGLGLLSKIPEVVPISTDEYPTTARRPENSKLCGDKLRLDYGVSPPEWPVDLRNCLQRRTYRPSK